MPSTKRSSSLTSPSDFDKAFEGIQVSEVVKGKLVEEIGRRLAPQPMKIAAVIEVNCFTKEGVEAIKEALRAGESLGTAELKISITLITPPCFVVSTMALLNKKKAIDLIDASIKAIDTAIRERGGSCKVKTPAHAVGKNMESEFEKGLLDQDKNGINPDEELEFEEDGDQ